MNLLLPCSHVMYNILFYKSDIMICITQGCIIASVYQILARLFLIRFLVHDFRLVGQKNETYKCPNSNIFFYSLEGYVIYCHNLLYSDKFSTVCSYSILKNIFILTATVNVVFSTVYFIWVEKQFLGGRQIRKPNFKNVWPY